MLLDLLVAKDIMVAVDGPAVEALLDLLVAKVIKVILVHRDMTVAAVMQVAREISDIGAVKVI